MEREIILLAHNIRSLWNIGSFFRTADAFGVSKILLSGYTSLPQRKEVTKTALGAESWIPWEKIDDPVQTLESLKHSGFTVVSLELSRKSSNLSDFRVTGPICLVVGHEILGVPEEILAVSDHIVKIPMLGKKHSLNVSVAAGVALYHLSFIC